MSHLRRVPNSLPMGFPKGTSALLNVVDLTSLGDL